MKKPNIKPLNLFSYIVLFFTFAFLCVLGWWLLYPYQTLEVKNMKVLTPQVAQGEEFEVEVHYVKKIDIPSRYIRDLIDGNIIHLSSGESNLPNGEHTITLNQKIPYEADVEKARIQSTFTYQVNPLRNISIRTITPEFEIIPEEGSIK